MKKLFLCLAAVGMLSLASCTSTIWTATTSHVDNCVYTSSVADLNVGSKATYTYQTTIKERKGGLKNCLNAAVASMLKANNNADVLVAPEYKYDSEVKVIQVSGYPATYTNFRSAPAVK